MIDSDAGEVFPIRRNLVNLFLHSSLDEKGWENMVTREQVLDLLMRALPGIDFTISDAMVDDGILDSMAITTIIAEISMEFGINVPFEELGSSNFNSIDAIVDLIGRCPKEGFEN